MSATGPIAVGRSIPSYELYGELLSGGYRDPVHHEHLRERSSRHDWTIRLHRHRGLAQIFLFRTGNVSFRLGDRTFTTTEPHVLFIPPGVAHGFRFDEEVDGDVLSLRVNDLWEGVAERLDQPSLQGAGTFARSSSENFEYIEALFVQIGRSYHGMQSGRAELLEALTRLLLAYISGDLRRDHSIRPVGHADGLTRHERQAEKFFSLLEAHFSEDLSVGDYSRKVGVSAPHLTRVCKTVLGSTPNELVRRRRLLEAKRLLEYTRLTVSEVSHRSGFRDPSFFSRTFRRIYGVPPKSYRDEKDG